MKRFNINKILVIASAAFLSLIMISCEKEVDVDLRSVEPQLVIEGIVAKDSLAKVKLTKTKDFNTDNEYIPISNAVVKISDDMGNSEDLPYNTSGWYIAPTLKGKEGQTYYLTVSYEGLEYTATSKMPPMVPIDSVSMFLFPTMDYAFPRVHFKDPLGTTNNYYRKKLFINGQYIKINHEAISAEQTDGISIVSILPAMEENLEDDEIKKGDLVTVELQSIDKGAYTFFDTLGKMDESYNNPTSNIVGGALGYFSAYSFDKKEIIADWK